MGERPDTTREETILSLSQDVRRTLADFQAMLDKRFDRVAVDKEKSESPQFPNVLDEIIGVLREDSVRLARIASFISSDVLPKIS